MWSCRVGVISLHGAPLSLPTLFDPSFKEFFRIGRAMRVVLPLGNGGIVHLFVICGYQGAESDPEKLQLSDHLFTAFFAEAWMCCAGQPVLIVGDFNADPVVIPSLAKGRGVAPSHTQEVCMVRYGPAFHKTRARRFSGRWKSYRGVQSMWPVLHVVIILLSLLGQAE